MKSLLLILTIIPLFTLISQPKHKNLPPEIIQVRYQPDPRPDRILLTVTSDPVTSFTVTWRTDTTVTNALAEIAVSDPSPDFDEQKTRHKAISSSLNNEFASALYHRVDFRDLKPATHYVYRVGDGTYWSEWLQHRTPDAISRKLTFVYLGDAQNNLHSLWSRSIREAYRTAPNAAFFLHAGDLINHSQNDYEWSEWFNAASFIFRSVPQLAAIGNHEYIKNLEGTKTGISPFWDVQFNFPQNGPTGLSDQSYYVDYPTLRLIVLNSNEKYEEQAHWLDQTLHNNDKKWVVVSFHHPVVSAARGRLNESVLSNWKPLLDKYKVDLVLQGHDHTYARGQNIVTGAGEYEKESGTVYVVSVCGAKMYELTPQEWMDRKAENTQLFQVVTLDQDQLEYKSYTADGNIYDAFRLVKTVEGQPNKLTELPVEVQQELRFETTKPNSNQLPDKN